MIDFICPLGKFMISLIDIIQIILSCHLFLKKPYGYQSLITARKILGLCGN